MANETSKEQLAALGMVTTVETVERLRSIRRNTDAWPHLLASQQWAVIDAADQLEWQPIETHAGHGTVIVSRPSDELAYQATTAFLDVTGVWRVFRSEGGMTPLRFVPTHWMPLPAPPTEAK